MFQEIPDFRMLPKPAASESDLDSIDRTFSFLYGNILAGEAMFPWDVEAPCCS